MEVLHAHCAGLDLHEDSVVVCVRHMVDGKVTTDVKTFRSTTQELMSLSDWLSAEGITHIAMEAGLAYSVRRRVRTSVGQRGPGQERAGTQDRCERRHLAG